MQKYMYEKAMAQETRNGGTSTLNNNNGVDNSKKKLLIALDIFCLLLGKFMNKFINCIIIWIVVYFFFIAYISLFELHCWSDTKQNKTKQKQ